MDATFEEYRRAIEDAHDIDIADFRERLPGGRAEGRPVTDFDLEQLIMGIEVETEHTTDKLLALEISMDHLAEIPTYYSWLVAMEKEAEEEMESGGEGEQAP